MVVAVLFGGLGYLAAVIAFGYGIGRLAGPLFGRAWRLFVAPGVIVHELAHALACGLVGAPVHEINFWKPSGGHVIHGPPRLHLIGPVVIAVAPTIVMTLALFGLLPLAGSGIECLPWTQTPPATVGQALAGYGPTVFRAFQTFHWLTLTPWFLMYAMLNVAVTMAPSRTDLVNARWPLVALIILVGLVSSVLAVRLPLALLWPPVATSLVLLGMAGIVAASLRAGFGLIIKTKRLRQA